MKRLITTWMFLGLVLCGCVRAQAQGDRGGFEFGTRPQDSVYDPFSVLGVVARKEISEALKSLAEAGEVDVSVAILGDIGDAPPEHVARKIAEEWSRGDCHAVVLHVPGNLESPWIVPGGSVIDGYQPALVANKVRSAERRARAEASDETKVEAAISEASDLLRFLANSSDNRRQQVDRMFQDGMRKYQRKQDLKRVIIVGGLASIVPTGVLLLWLASGWRKRRPRMFPNVSIVPRLGAPHAGGAQFVGTIPRRRNQQAQRSK